MIGISLLIFGTVFTSVSVVQTHHTIQNEKMIRELKEEIKDIREFKEEIMELKPLVEIIKTRNENKRIRQEKLLNDFYKKESSSSLCLLKEHNELSTINSNSL